MPWTVSKTDIWAGTIEDQPGGLDRVIAALADSGANLECVLARRHPGGPGGGAPGDVFLTPVKGAKQMKAAQAVGLKKAEDIGTLRVELPNKPGIGHKMLAAIAAAGINLRGVSATTLGNKAIVYLGFDSPDDAARAAKAIKAAGK